MTASSVNEVMTSCFTERFSSTFHYNSRQCLDIADYLDETAPFRQHAWDEGRIRALQCQPAIMEFCRAIHEANLFLQECSADFWKNAYNSLTKLDTGEAYNVLLHNLIWSKVGLDLAILYELHSSNIDYNKEIKKRVDKCQLVLSRYASDLTQARLNRDRAEFYMSVENPQIGLYCDESQKKCLTFLVQKSKAYKAYKGAEPGAQHLDVFEIDPHDIASENHFLESGSFSEVYRRSWLGQTVAVKVYRDVQSELFKGEVSLLAGLQNPFIVHMVGWCAENNGKCILVMELTPTDLRKVIDLQHFISRPAAVDIMLQISKGMEYLHKRRIVHRDLKPGNVLLEPSPVQEMAAQGYARVKICDFGIAKVKELVSAKDQTDQDSTFNAGTSYYEAPGTSYYRAPEVLSEGEESKYSCKVDVFSFAITCSEMLAGKTGPTCYRTSTKKIRERMLKNVRPDLPTDCPSHLAELINKCWDTDPKRRPSFSKVSNTLTYIKFILMRFSDVQRVRYVSVVSPFDEEELKRCVSEDEEFGDQEELEDSHIDFRTINFPYV